MSGLGKAAGVILRQAVLFFRSEARLLPDWTAASSSKGLAAFFYGRATNGLEWRLVPVAA
jgi:hypothetical protein